MLISIKLFLFIMSLITFRDDHNIIDCLVRQVLSLVKYQEGDMQQLLCCRCGFDLP